MNEPLNQNKIREELEQFYGTEQYYFNPLFRNIKYTDGITYMYNACKAHWLLIDLLANCQVLNKKHEFLAIKLLKDPKQTTCRVFYEDGNNIVLKRTDYQVTDFPLDNQIVENKVQPAITFFFRDNILYLPSEY